MAETGLNENADPAWIALHGVSIIQFLYHDRRPTFVLDLQKAPLSSGLSSSALFINPALRERRSLLELLDGHGLGNSSTIKQDCQVFLSWIKSLDRNASATQFQFSNFNWSCTTLEARWRVFVADTIQDPCKCATREPKPTPKSSSTLISEELLSIKHAETGPGGKPSRENSRSTSTTNKSLNTLTRARHFFAGEPVKKDNDKDVRATLITAVSEENTTLDANAAENPTFGIWSDIRIAKRNADLLAKISGFETIGISITDNDGTIIFANDAWYNICGIPHGPADAASWMNIFEPAEMPKIVDVWKRITIDQKPGSFQTPLKWRWDSPAVTDSGIADFPVWISVWTYPDVSVDGETIGCCTVLTDISQQKWTERLIEQQLANAVERASVLEQLSNDLALTESRFRRISDSMPHGIFGETTKLPTLCY